MKRKFHFVPLAAVDAPAPAVPPTAFAAAAPTIALTICAVPGSCLAILSISRAGIMLGNLVNFFNHGFVEACPRGARCEARPRDAAHDAADSRVDKDLQII